MKQFVPYYSFFFLLLCCLAPVSAQSDKAQYAVKNISPNLITERTAAVVRDAYEHFQIESVRKSTLKVMYTITLLNKRAENLRTCEIYYDTKFNKVSNIEAAVYDANGKMVQQLKSKHIRDVELSGGSTIASDGRAKVIDLEHYEYPMTIEYSYEMKDENMMFYPNWQPQFDDDVAVEKSTLHIESKIGDVVRHKSVLTDEPNIKMNGNKVEYEWRVKNIPIANEEIFSYQSFQTPIVYTAPKAFELDGYKGDMNTWENFGAFLYKLHEGRDELSEEFVTQLKQLTKACDDPKCKVEKIYSYLQANTRYVSIQLGIGGWQPFKASHVQKNKYGDCKGLSNFTKAMLKAVGVEAYCCAIKSGPRHEKLLPDFPISRFNHEIACVPLEKDTIWLECTSQDNPMGYLGKFIDDRDVLLITPQGGKIAHTKSYTPQDNQQNRTGTIQIDEITGTATCNVQTIYTGQQVEGRDYVVGTDIEKKKELLLSEIQMSNVTVSAVDYTLEKTMIPKLTLTAKLQLRVYAKKSGKRLFVPLNSFEPFRLASIDTSKGRTLPIQFRRISMEDKDEWKIEIPEGFSVEESIKPVKIESRFGVFESSVEVNGNVAIYKRRILLNNKKHPADSMAELIKFGQSIERADRVRMVLVEK